MSVCDLFWTLTQPDKLSHTLTREYLNTSPNTETK